MNDTPQPNDATRVAVGAIGYAPPEPFARWSGKGFLPAAASFYVPGLGQFIAGDRRRAAAWFIAWVACFVASLLMLATPTLFVGVIVLLPAQFVLTIACVVDAFRRGRVSPRPMLRRPVFRYFAGIGFILAAAFLLHPTVPVAMFVRHQWAETFVMPTGGMMPTLRPGDRFIVHKRLGDVRRWDVLAFDSPQYPGDKWAQRVTGLPGETVELIGGELHVNSVLVMRPPGVGPYQLPLREVGNAAAGHPLTLGPDEYFMLGDNSAISNDGRYWDNPPPGRQPGVLPRDRIIGRVTAIYWPLARWKRF